MGTYSSSSLAALSLLRGLTLQPDNAPCLLCAPRQLAVLKSSWLCLRISTAFAALVGSQYGTSLHKLAAFFKRIAAPKGLFGLMGQCRLGDFARAGRLYLSRPDR